MIDSVTEVPNTYPQVLHVRAHTFRSDMPGSSGGADSAPGPHDYFDAALASCKSLTATWYARKHGIALERVETEVERDATEERNGKYTLRVKVRFHGALSAEDRQRLYVAVSHCPIHKLMTTADVVIETAPLEEAP